MKRVLVAVTILMLTLVMYSSHKQLQEYQYILQGLQTQIQNETQERANYDGWLTNRIAYLHRSFDLSVLNSCGIITNGFGHGSCVAVGPDLILTAGHCLEYKGLRVEILGQKYDILEQWCSEKYDIGFVRIKGILPCIKLGRKPKLLDTVYSVGAPGHPAFVTNISKGVVTNIGVNYYVWPYATIVDAPAYAGSSGGPVFNEDGKIILIHVGRPCTGNSICIGVPVHQIRSALREYYARNTL